ncbi:hypothetical protein NG796_07220 [Laspinema sp. A4]|uniref:hypothetical protein n=1 Tax=Laspinema sp. D2d TaxID=2953686 RepID=UPI0021BAAB8E|nr:hypothetical protein [Laspinema sp. D2d]MCT7983079.1 hypothetical protein [Laspinema sp. D2d]
MKSQLDETKIANIIKKWLKTIKEIQEDTGRNSVQVTRLTSIKSLCKDRQPSKHFALHIAKRVWETMESTPNDRFDETEWQAHKAIVTQAIAQMEAAIEEVSPQQRQSMAALREEIKLYQGNDYRRTEWAVVHFIRSGNLLKVDYALCCFINQEYQYYTYQLAREYAENYDINYGNGLNLNSLPMLLDIAEFWCQYYFNQSLDDRFPKLVSP